MVVASTRAQCRWRRGYLVTTGDSCCGTRQRHYCSRQRLCRVPHSAKAPRQILGRQRAECLLSGTRQRLCLVSLETFGKEKLPWRRFYSWRSLCRVPPGRALGKEIIFLKKKSLPSVSWEGTRQRNKFYFKKILYRVSPRRALGKEIIFFKKKSLPSVS